MCCGVQIWGWKCYSVPHVQSNHIKKKKKHVEAWLCFVQSDQTLNRKDQREDSVHLVLITPHTYFLSPSSFCQTGACLQCTTILNLHWPWLCLLGHSRFLKPWGGSNAFSMTSFHLLLATKHPRSLAQTPSCHRNTPVGYTIYNRSTFFSS